MSATLTTPAAAPRSTPERTARLANAPESRLAAWHVVVPVLVVVGLTTVAWVSHGGVAALLGGGRGAWLALGQLSGLWLALAGWAGVILAARPGIVERRFGLDGLLRVHRWVGIGTGLLVLVHVGAVLIAGRADGATSVASMSAGLVALLAEPWMVAAVAGATLFVLVALSSWRRLRTRMAYETWYFLHLTGYLGVLLAVAHQFTAGTDIATDPVVLAWWVAVSAGAVLVVVFARVRDVAETLVRGRLTVTAVEPVAPDTVAVTVAGPGLASTRVSAGQYFRVRLLTRGRWWQSHPFSVSAEPTSRGLRFTIKALGDGTRDLQHVPVGARVLLSGPYGVFTARRAQGRPVVLVGGGVGLAPLRSVLADCGPTQTPVVVARARRPSDVPHRDEMRQLAAQRRGTYHEVLGPTAHLAADPFGEPLRRAVPDLADREAFVCGPNRLVRAAVRGLRDAGVPAARIHTEFFPV